MGKIIIIATIFYFLAIIQSTFLPHFVFGGLFFNPLFIAVILVNLFEKIERKSGWILAGFAGFFLDIFSGGFWQIHFFGFWILIMLFVAAFTKFIFKKNLRLDNG